RLGSVSTKDFASNVRAAESGCAAGWLRSGRRSEFIAVASARVRERHCPLDYGFEHDGRETPRLRVVATAVIRIKQHPSPAQGMLRGMCESKFAAAQIAGTQHRRVRDGAQRQDNAGVGTLRQLLPKESVADSDLQGRWLVAGRQAFDRIRDARALKRERVVRGARGRGARKAEFEQG